MNIIADVAGQFNALVRLLDKMPQEKTIFVGDLVDRGPDSNKVLDLVSAMVKNNGDVALMGNHEHMMLDFCWAEPENKIYESGIWTMNGGYETLRSYGCLKEGWCDTSKVNQDHLVFIGNMPLFYEDENLLVTHAPWFGGIPWEKALLVHKNGNLHEGSILWNRRPPIKQAKLQVFGHNSHWGLTYFNDKGHHHQDDPENPWAVCLDDSRKQVLTGMHYPTMKIYQEPYTATSEPFNEENND